MVVEGRYHGTSAKNGAISWHDDHDSERFSNCEVLDDRFDEIFCVDRKGMRT